MKYSRGDILQMGVTTYKIIFKVAKRYFISKTSFESLVYGSLVLWSDRSSFKS